MTRFPLILGLLTILLSATVLIIDSQTEQGLLNMISEKKTAGSDPGISDKHPIPVEHASEQQADNAESSDSKENIQEQTKAANEGHIQQEQPAGKEQQPSQKDDIPFIVCIDPGHQAKGNSEQEPIGPGATETKDKVTSGTSGAATKKPEHVLNLEASIILKDLLEKEGIQVIMTRSSHDVDISNRERAEIANKAKANLFVRVHADGSENPNTNGFSVLVPAQSNPYTKNVYEDSNEAGRLIVNRVSGNNYPILGNGLFPREDLSGFNWSQVPVILLELGFMTNTDEDLRLSDEKYLSGLMKEVTDGILDYKSDH